MKKQHKTRYERLVGTVSPSSPSAKNRPAIERVRRRGDRPDWEQKARSNAAFPFEVDIIETILPEEPEEPENEVIESDREFPPIPPPERLISRRIIRSMVHQTMKTVVENGLQQAYISGCVDGIYQMELMLTIIQFHAPKNKRLLEEMREHIKRFKDDVAEGRKTG